MPAKLYVVNGSHPCVTVEEALRRKGVPYKTVELMPPSHPAIMRPLFGARTVPGIRFEDGTKVQGSRPILRALEQRAPTPSLFGTDPERRAQIEEAEGWGDQVLQPLVRRLLWLGFKRNPAAMHGYQAGSKLPKMPVAVIKLIAPVATRIELRMNASTPEGARADRAALPGHFDKIDGWIESGLLGGEEPNAADLQIAPSLRLIYTIGDVQPLLEGRPALALAHKWLPPLPGAIPAGVLP